MDHYFAIQHFAHPEHPLILTDLKKTQGDDDDDDGVVIPIWCDFCMNELLVVESSAYCCITCDFHLHKLCAKLPEQMIHPNHDPGHPLTLIRSNYVDDRILSCNFCLGNNYRYSYNCESCKFEVDARCASLALAINHKGHPHPLHPFLRKALVECDACGKEHSAAGVSYQCRTCAFWVHEDCATLPTTALKYHGHVHPLSILLPDPTDTITCVGRCNICEELMFGKHHWIYHCRGCDHNVHVNCLAATLVSEISDENEADYIDLTTMFQLPESFQYDDLITLMIKHMTTTRNYKAPAAEEDEDAVVSQVGPLSHFSHHHPLTLISCNLPRNNDKGGNSKKKKKEEEQDLIICNACVLPVSTPALYYTCTTCSENHNSYVLHEWCAKLPNELPHPALPSHTLTLRETPEAPSFQIGICISCHCFTNGYIYLMDCFGVDIKCVCLPSSILHKAHQHPLKLLPNCHDKGCVACPRSTYFEFAYGCNKCCFYLHASCALQPITIVHRYDVEHPFVLIDAPIKDGPVEYVCEFCEKDIDPMWWFYHCLPCDLSACASCIFKEKHRKFYINPRITYSSEVHNHPCSYVQVDRRDKTSLCSRCQQDFAEDQYALQCVQCNIMFHDREICILTKNQAPQQQ